MTSNAVVRLEPTQPDMNIDCFNALQLIINAPRTTILAHHGPALLAFQKLVEALSCSTISEISSPPNEPIPYSVLSLVSIVEQRTKQITSDLKLWQTKSIDESLDREDPHLFDMSFAVKNHSSRPFMLGLKYRRLALDYEAWEKGAHRMSTIQTMMKDLKKNVKSTGHINHYVKRHLSFQEPQTTIRNLQHGIKMLVVEGLFQVSVISAVLCFTYTGFRNLKFKDLRQLKMSMQDLPWISELIQKEQWYQQCQKKFDQRVIPAKIILPQGAVGKKRPAELDTPFPEPNAKRLDMSGEHPTGAEIGCFAETAILNSNCAFPRVQNTQQLDTMLLNNSTINNTNEDIFTVAENEMDPSVWQLLDNADVLAGFQPFN